MGRDLHPAAKPDGNSIVEIFTAFLKLGLTSFGGPIAHIGYFRDELVLRRKWVSEKSFADLLALCQFLPGPASSQLGFLLGLMRGGGLLGGVAAFLGFTLPSALALLAFAYGAGALYSPLGEGLLHGLKLVAVAIVAQAIWGMSKSLTPDKTRLAIGFGALLIAALAPAMIGQIAAMLFGVIAGLALCRQTDEKADPDHALQSPFRKSSGLIALSLLLLIFIVPPLIAAATGSQALALFDAFYRSGALVFGGGHVVLPLLQAEIVGPGWASQEAFLSGYGAAQAVPGPLFTFAAYLGAIVTPSPNGVLGAIIALGAIFLPGFLLVLGILPFWGALSASAPARAGMRGANAAVVGLLAAAFHDPVWTSAVLTPFDFVAVIGGFLLLTIWKAPPFLIVILLALAGMISTLI